MRGGKEKVTALVPMPLTYTAAGRDTLGLATQNTAPDQLSFAKEIVTDVCALSPVTAPAELVEWDARVGFG